MAANFNKQSLKFITLIFLVCLPVMQAFPSPASDDEMVHNNNYDMIMTDDHAPAESMRLQNFDEFFNSEKAANDAMNEMEMDESHISSVYVAPQSLNAREKELREQLEDLDVQREKRVQRSLPKGSIMARKNVHEWKMFDYDMFLNDH